MSDVNSGSKTINRVLKGLQILTPCLVSHLVPSNHFHFSGPRENGKWPKNPLLPLIQVFPSLKHDLYEAFFRRCSLEFSGYSDKKTVISGSSTAIEFFRLLHPKQRQCVTNIQINISCLKAKDLSEDEETSMLDFIELLATSLSPTRHLKDLTMHFESSSALDVARRYYTLKGLGNTPTVVFTSGKYPLRSISQNQQENLKTLNELIVRRKEEPKVVSFSRLPPELRLMIYKYLASEFPKSFEIMNWHLKKTPSAHVGHPNIGNLFLIFPELMFELSKLLYGTCHFHLDYTPRTRNPQLYNIMNGKAAFGLFLQKIGHNANMICHVRITIEIIADNRTLVPELKTPVGLLKRKTKIGYGDLENIWEESVEEVGLISYFSFTVPRKGNTSLEFVVQAPLYTQYWNSFPEGTRSRTDVVHYVLHRSLEGYQSVVNQDGRVKNAKRSKNM